MIDTIVADVRSITAPVDHAFPLDGSEWFDRGFEPAIALSQIPASAGLAMELEFGIGPSGLPPF